MVFFSINKSVSQNFSPNSFERILAITDLPDPIEPIKQMFFLSNFGNWKDYLGIENNALVKEYSKNFFLRKYLLYVVFGKQLELWKRFNNYKKDIYEFV